MISGALLLKVPAARKLAYDIPARIKRLIFIACDSARSQELRRQVQCIAVNDDFRKAKLNHPTQKKIVETLLKSIREGKEETGTYDVIVAPSGFGKTRTATLLAEALIRDRSFCVLADNFHYYDFARGYGVQNQFLSRLGGLVHSEALVVVDNFHLAGPVIIQETTRRLLDILNSTTERHLIFLAQPLENWRLRAGSEIRLLSHARESGRLHSINALTREDIAKAQLSADVLRKIRTFSKSAGTGSASIAEIQATQVEETGTVHQKQLAERVSNYLFSQGYQRPDPPGERLVAVVATATALAMFKGVFDKGSFRRAFFYADPHKGIRRLWDQFRSLGDLRLLSKSGIIPRSSLPGKLYVMHERLAEYFRDTIATTDATFLEVFEKALMWRLGTSDGKSDPTLNWLAGVELRNLDRMNCYFGRAMAEGNLKSMGARLRKAVDVLHADAAQFQLGVILDKSGSFAEARSHLSQIAVTPDVGGFSAKAKLALLEAEHDEERLETVLALGSSQDPLIRLSSVFWKIHIGAHKGRFDPESLRSLGVEIFDTFDAMALEADFFLSTLLSRVYFDTLRHVLLRRSDVAQQILANGASPVADVVAKTDPCFKANTILYERAHFLEFIVLPALAVFSDRLSYEDTLGIGAHTGDVADLASRIEQEYSNAQDEFSVFGNRERYYLDGDILNARIQNPTTDIQDLRVGLAEYHRFISAAGFEDLLSYPFVYEFRLAVRAWRDALLDPQAYKQDFNTLDEYRDDALRALKKVEILDTACRNTYGLWRKTLYAILLEAVSGDGVRPGSIEEKLERHAAIAEEQGFLGDADFVHKLVRQSRLRISDIMNALIYHPFVHQ